MPRYRKGQDKSPRIVSLGIRPELMQPPALYAFKNEHQHIHGY